MIYKVLKSQLIYNNCPIVVRQAGEMFEYITCVDFEIYSSNIIAKKTLLQKVFLRDYSKKQIQDITNMMIAMAQTTIDTVQAPVTNSPKIKK